MGLADASTLVETMKELFAVQLSLAGGRHMITGRLDANQLFRCDTLDIIGSVECSST